MTTAVDSSVLLAIFRGESNADQLLRQLEKFLEIGRLIICDVIVAEVGAFFESPQDLLSKLKPLEIHYSPIEFKAAHYAGRIYREYRQKGGVRATMVPDFLIASHAMIQANQLWAMDRGYYRSYFKPLKIVPFQLL